MDQKNIHQESSVIVASDDLLALAQEAGHLGVFEWHIPSGRLLLSPYFLSIYGLEEFDGRYESWLQYIYREDKLRVADLIEQHFCQPAAGADNRVSHRPTW